MLAATLAMLAPFALRADIDWSAYAKSVEITFSGYAGSSALANFPVLVRVSAVNGFDYAKFQAAGGGDLRFSDAAGNLLASEIDTWNDGGESLVWVKVPELTSATTITAHYGCASPVTALAASDVWSEGYVGVWHLSQGALPLAESSGVSTPFGESTGSSLAYGYPGKIGGALDLHSGNGRSGGVFADDDDDLDGFSDITIECWLRQDVATSSSGYGSLVQKVSSGNADYSYRVYSPATRRFDFLLSGTGSVPSGTGSGVRIENHCNGPALETWYHQAFTYALSNKKSDVYVDGAPYWTYTGYWDLGGPIHAGAAKLSIGAGWTTGAMAFEGQIDELRISRTARSADWIRATHDTVAAAGFAEYEAVASGNDWDSYAKKFSVTFDGAPAGTLANFPVLVKIAEDSPAGFSYADLRKRNGGDLRFSDENGNLLSSEIDTWDENGTSLVWVKVPALAASTKITAYYGWAEAPAVTASDVWSEGYVGVWHLGDAGNQTQADSTTNRLDFLCHDKEVQNVDLAVSGGAAGGAVGFDKAGTGYGGLYLVDADSKLSGFMDCTIEAWLYPTNDTTGRYFLVNETSWEQGAFQLVLSGGKNPRMMSQTEGKEKVDYPSALNAVCSVGDWHHVAFARTGASGSLGGYVDGVLDATRSTSAGRLVTSTGPVVLGNRGITLVTWASTYYIYHNYSFLGYIDEVRISGVARSAEWIKATHDTIADSAFATCGRAKDNAGSKMTLLIFR